MRQTLTKVTFSELHEVRRAFGHESISPGGGVFSKHLIYSYDLKTQTIIFPFGWVMQEYGGTNEDGWKRTGWEFFFSSTSGNHWRTILRHNKVKKIDFVEVDDYDQKQFEPEQGLVLMNLTILHENKDRADGLIQKYLTDGTIVAERSRETTVTNIIVGENREEKTVSSYLYELVMKESERINFINQLFEQDIVPKTDRFAILIEQHVFPKQLSYFKK